MWKFAPNSVKRLTGNTMSIRLLNRQIRSCLSLASDDLCEVRRRNHSDTTIFHLWVNEHMTTHQVDVVLGSETMCHNRHRSCRIGRKVNSYHVSWKRKKRSNETRILFPASVTPRPSKEGKLQKNNLPDGSIHYCTGVPFSHGISKSMRMLLTVPVSI